MFEGKNVIRESTAGEVVRVLGHVNGALGRPPTVFIKVRRRRIHRLHLRSLVKVKIRNSDLLDREVRIVSEPMFEMRSNQE